MLSTHKSTCRIVETTLTSLAQLSQLHMLDAAYRTFERALGSPSRCVITLYRGTKTQLFGSHQITQLRRDKTQVTASHSDSHECAQGAAILYRRVPSKIDMRLMLLSGA